MPLATEKLWWPGRRLLGATVDCVKALRERGWYGDDELADHLDAVLGVAVMLMLRPLPVDLAELAGILEGDELGGGGRIDRQTGDVWHRAAIEYAQEMGEEDPDDLTTRRGGSGWSARDRVTATGTWRCSSGRSATRTGGPARDRRPGPGCLPAVQGCPRPLAR